LTDQLCCTAWAQFQEIEQSGGAWAALEQGLIQRKIAAVRAERARAVARRADPLTGSSDFPDLAEIPVAVLEAVPLPLTSYPRAIGFDALPAIRLAEPFEKLRDASDRMLARSGRRPKIFLAKLGNASDFTKRATFAKNFFEAGGIEALGNNGSAGHDEMIAAFNRSHAGVACLCSSNAVYAREAIAAAKALIAAGCRHLYLAGRAGASEPALRAAGVEDFVFSGCDALAVLNMVHRQLGLGP
jgi:methylmalonyl-CoA mutase